MINRLSYIQPTSFYSYQKKVIAHSIKQKKIPNSAFDLGVPLS